MAAGSVEIRCSSCGRLLAMRPAPGLVEVKAGGREVRIYQAPAIGFTCDRCRRKEDIPGVLTEVL